MTLSHGSTQRGNGLLSFVLLVGLALGTGGLYWQALGFDFVNVDDTSYVTKNIYVQRGLSAANVVWAFRSTLAANWHPLAWLSHMLDVELFGLDPGGHHLGNVLLHIANTLLLFGLLRSMTGAIWRSASVAILFAIHPLHVESVAWVSERKDVLCAFFWLLAMWSYSRQTTRSSLKSVSLALPLALTAAALLAKPMAVTLPFTLLLLDYWPLGRLNRSSLRSLVVEKLPFFALSLISAWMTLIAQRAGNAMRSSSDVGIGLRIANAAVSYVTYLLKCVWPSDLAYLYPHPNIPGSGGVPWELWQIAGSIALLLAISTLVAFCRRPYLSVGWLWYLGTLVPVIGLIQVGTQAFADRYTYIPLIGIFVMVVWGVADLAARLRMRSRAFDYAGLVLLLALLVTLGSLSSKQVSHWRDSIPLFEQALRVTPNATIAHLALGSVLIPEDRLDEALVHAKRALELKPDYGEAYDMIGRIQGLRGRHAIALRNLLRAVRFSPNSPRLHLNLATGLLRLNSVDEGIEHYERAASLDTDWPAPHMNLGKVHYLRRDYEQSLSRFQSALEIQPELLEARFGLGKALEGLERWDEAAAQYQLILAREPGHARARYRLEQIERAGAGGP